MNTNTECYVQSEFSNVPQVLFCEQRVSHDFSVVIPQEHSSSYILLVFIQTSLSFLVCTMPGCILFTVITDLRVLPCAGPKVCLKLRAVAEDLSITYAYKMSSLMSFMVLLHRCHRDFFHVSKFVYVKLKDLLH